MTSAQKTSLIVMAVAVTIAVGVLIFMMKQIAGSTPKKGSGGGADTAQISKPKDAFVAKCQTGAFGSVDCNCLTGRLESVGYDTDDDWQSLMTALDNASASPQSAAAPVDYTQEFNSCRV